MDPHPALLREYLRLVADYNHHGADSDKGKATWVLIESVERLLEAMPATTPAGVTAHWEFLVEYILEQGNGCAIKPHVVKPQIQAFRAGLTNLGGTTASASDTPSVMAALFADWSSYWTWLNTADEEATPWSDKDWEVRYAILSSIEDRMDVAPVASLGDLALKMAAWTSFLAVVPTDTPFEQQAIAVVGATSAAQPETTEWRARRRRERAEVTP